MTLRTVLLLGVFATLMIQPETAQADNRLTRPLFAVDELYLAETTEAFSGQSRNIIPDDTTQGLQLRPKQSGTEWRGTYWSPTIRTPFSFQEVLPSWNIGLDESTQGYRVTMRFMNADGAYSPWLYFAGAGTLAQTERRSPVRNSPRWGQVLIDYAVLQQDSVGFQYRIDLQSTVNPVGKNAMTIRRFAVSYTNRVGDEGLYRAKQKQLAAERAGLRFDLIPSTATVGYRSQHDVADTTMGKSICGPTSLSMILEAAGIVLPTEAVAKAAKDPENGIYGNWPRLAMLGHQHGLRSWIQRFRSHEDAKATLASGYLLICSIRMSRGELTNANYKRTGGHLMVIQGFTADGDYIVNDPTCRGPNGAEIVYKRDDMEKAWLEKGGVGIVFDRRELKP